MPSSTTIVKILWRYKLREELTEEELAELRLWLMESPKNEDLFDELSDTARWNKNLEKWKGKDADPTWNKISKRLESISPLAFQRKRERGRYLIAASVFLVLFSAVLYYWLNKNHNGKPQIVTQQQKTGWIQPARGGSVLTLSNGNNLFLDSLSSGTQTSEGNTEIKKTDSEALSYKNNMPESGEEKFNTLKTGKGNQYYLELSDGTKVWLNATSTLKFPVAFTGNQRQVELSGEAYFEVTKNKLKPFTVLTGHSLSVKVLGTHFNIKAYPDESQVNVTLLEGSISAGNTKDSRIVKPGEELTENGGGGFHIIPANAEQTMAWRNRLFWFKKASFGEVMRTLSRWYDMEVTYEGEIKESYTGILPVNLPLSNVLHILEKGGNVHFTIEGSKVTVRP